jgi:pimeloyl-ACP methyl ester carboxylesterase
MKLGHTFEGKVTEKHPFPLLFVHGAWQNASFWREKFMPFFAARGYECHALDLRGHGQSEAVPNINTVSLSDYVSDVVTISKTLPKEPILIGHSMGGLIAQKFIQTNPAKAAVLMASCPPSGMKETFERLGSEHQGMGMKYLFTRNTDLMIKDKALTKELFFRKDFPDKLFDGYYQNFQTESYKAVNEMRNGIGTTGLNPNKIPVNVIGGGEDYFFRPKDVKETARLYGSEPFIAEGQGHTLMVEMGWQSTADEISDWLGRNGL